MSLKEWHPGKLVLLWGLSLAVLALLLFARPENCNDVAMALWLALIAPLARWTWDWAGAREGGLDKTPSEEEGDQDWTRRVGKGVALFVWLGVTIGLFLSYLVCRAPLDIQL